MTLKRDIKSCKYHVTWIPKYRKKYLYGEIKIYIKIFLLIKSRQLNTKIENIQIMPDHIHIFISIPTTLSISSVVKQLKGYSSYQIRKRFNLYNYKAFWNTGYFCESVGHISQTTIKKYIDNQWKNYKQNSSPH